MCGIAGLLTANRQRDHLQHSIQQMQIALGHRGPDGRGIFVAPQDAIALAHTRLAILDLSLAGHQPMSSPDGRYWISFNGEIYNFSTLRSQLVAQGESFQSQTDTEVILKLYQQLGWRCVLQLRGMFAFAIWDDREKTCFLARDPLGIKPLYYWQSGHDFVFASELRAVVASGLPAKQLSAPGLYGYLTQGSVPEPYTLIEDIHLLQAGHWLLWQVDHLQQHCYWKNPLQTDHGSTSNHAANMSLADVEDQVRQAVLESLQYHFVSDVPVGVFLSGGIDSTALVALSRQIQSGKLHTYSIAFEETQWDESDVAQKTAQHFETQHLKYVITAEVGRSLLPKFLSALDQPTIDGFNTFCVSHLAHSQNIKVVLSGLGGDELFGGYPSFQTVTKMVRRRQQLRYLQPLTTLLGIGLEELSQSSRLRRLGNFLQQPASISAAYQCFRGIFSPLEALAIVQHYLPDAVSVKCFGLDEPVSLTPLDAVSILEMSGYMRNQLLRDGDVMSMAWGLEMRVPFVDQELLAAIAPIPAALRLAPGKQLLIRSIPELPEWVINRPKQGFFFPYERWMQQEWQDLVQGVECPQRIPLSPWYRRWSLVILQHWWRQISR